MEKHMEKQIKKVLAIIYICVYNSWCCGMIAVKREVAAHLGGFSAERMSS